MNTHRLLPLTLVALAALGACTSLPTNNVRLDEARDDYRAARNEPQTRDLAAAELKQASAALLDANGAWTRNAATAEVDHLAYLAQMRVAIARETGRQKAAEQEVAGADAARAEARLEARTNEADAARRSTGMALQDADASQRQAAASQRQNDDAQARVRQLELQLAALGAKKTERGMVVTIGSLQFDTDRSQLKPDGLRSVDKLVRFLEQHPQRKALVEGFTDSTGSASRNRTLSGQRADAVRSALVQRGVASERVAVRGYGDAFPVAGNDSADGRQSNRRVEVVLSGDDGAIAAR